MINDTMIKYSSETGYPVTKVKRRRRVVPAVRPTQPGSQKILRAAMSLVAALLALLAALWLAVGVASHASAYQAQHVADPVTATSVVYSDQSQAAPAQGQSWATVSIPAIDLEDIVVLEGTDAEQINAGVGHYTGTEFPWNDGGNVALAGHRTGWGQPFHDIDELQPGDEVIVETDDQIYTYTVTGTDVVDPSETWVLEDVPTSVTGASGNSQLLTLTTCEGEQNEERLIVWAELTDVTSVES